MDDAKNDAILKNAGLAGIQPEHTVPPHVKQFGTVLAPAEFDEACAVPCPLAVENGVPTTLFANFAPRYIWTLPDSDCLLVAPSAITNSSLCVRHLRVCGPLYTEETPAIAELRRLEPPQTLQPSSLAAEQQFYLYRAEISQLKARGVEAALRESLREARAQRDALQKADDELRDALHEARHGAARPLGAPGAAGGVRAGAPPS